MASEVARATRTSDAIARRYVGERADWNATTEVIPNTSAKTTTPATTCRRTLRAAGGAGGSGTTSEGAVLTRSGWRMCSPVLDERS